jgi:hypothetical protein
MGKLVLVRNLDGELVGISPRDDREYQKLAATLEQLAPGETVCLSFAIPRAPEYHRAHFRLLGLIFEAQGAFADPADLRYWLEVGAGHCARFVAPDGETIAYPKSLAYDELDELDFCNYHANVIAFLRTPRAARTLWPYLDERASLTRMDTILVDYERRGQDDGTPFGPGRR